MESRHLPKLSALPWHFVHVVGVEKSRTLVLGGSSGCLGPGTEAVGFRSGMFGPGLRVGPASHGRTRVRDRGAPGRGGL